MSERDCLYLWGYDVDDSDPTHVCFEDRDHEGPHVCDCGARHARVVAAVTMSIDDLMAAVCDSVMTAACSPDPDDPIFPPGVDVSTMSCGADQWIEIDVGDQTFRLDVKETSPTNAP